MLRKIILPITAGLVLSSSVYAKDFIGEFMKNGVATFTDAATLLYYSFRSTDKKGSKKAEEAAAKKAKSLSPDEIRSYLKARGIDLPVKTQPISRESFAKTLLKRFSLDVSISTKVFGWENLYYSDAQRLGIFSKQATGSGVMTTRGMLTAFFRAQDMARR